MRQKLIFGAESESDLDSQMETSVKLGTGADAQPSSPSKKEAKALQKAAGDALNTTGVIKIRSFWPLPAAANVPGVPPAALAETGLTQTLHTIFEEGHINLIPHFGSHKKPAVLGEDPHGAPGTTGMNPQFGTVPGILSPVSILPLPASHKRG